MNDIERIEKGLAAINSAVEENKGDIDRFAHEIRFARRLTDAKPEKQTAKGG